MPDTRTHPGGDLIYRVAPRVSMGFGDSVESGQVGTPLPGRGHPPSASAAAACRGPSGHPSGAAIRLPNKTRSSEGAVAPRQRLHAQLYFRVGKEASGSDRIPRARDGDPPPWVLTGVRTGPGKRARSKWLHRHSRHCGDPSHLH